MNGMTAAQTQTQNHQIQIKSVATYTFIRNKFK